MGYTMRFAKRQDTAGVPDTAKTLVMAAVSVGNAGQLALDLLIETLSLSCVGYLDSDSVAPMAGAHAFIGSDGVACTSLAASLEVYTSSSDAHRDYVFLQQRAPLLKGRTGAFVDEVLSWAHAHGITTIVLVGSTDSSERTASQIEGPQFRYMTSAPLTSINLLSECVGRQEWLEMEKRDMSILQDGSGPFACAIYGGGIARCLHKKCVDNSSEAENASPIKSVLLLRFCSEGDNRPDAHALATKANELLQLSALDTQWKTPFSWRHFYGSVLRQRY